jgi:GT2 family glycosyltransferase
VTNHICLTSQVSIVIVGYNSRVDLEANLPGLAAMVDCELILVDNASSDETAQYVRRRFPAVHVVESGENLGFGGACNLGADHAASDVLLFLNPDISIDEESVFALAAAVRRNGSVVGPVIIDEGSGDRQYGFRLDYLGMTVESLVPVPPLFVQGCALAIDANLFRRIGGFEARYFLFSEDAELCWRAAGTGAEIAVVPDALAYHGGGHSIPGGYVTNGHRQVADGRFALRERNTLAMFVSNAPILFLLAFVPVYACKLLAFAGWAGVTGRRGMARSLVSALTWNGSEISRTLGRRRSRPGATDWAWLRRRLVPTPAILTHLRRHGWPTFIGSGTPQSFDVGPTR